MDDLISRKELCEYALNQKDKAITPNDIMRFPAAVPNPKVVRCGKCKYWTGTTSEIDPEMRQCEFGLWMEQTDFCSLGDDGKIPMPGVYARPQ